MAITTIVGIVAGLAAIVISILLEGNLMNFWSASSLFVVFGGLMASTVASYSGDELKSIMVGFKVAFKSNGTNISQTIEKIVELATIARREGLLALEGSTQEISNSFMKKGVMLIVDGTDPSLVKGILETQSDYIQDRHANLIGIFATMQGYSPAYGMVGTLIGLINMLMFLDDPDVLGPSMGVALITTFYGVVFANLIFGPVANKMKSYSSEEELECMIIIEGILSIQNGENPRLIKEKLLAFVSDSQVKKLGLDEDKKAGETN